MRRGDLVTVVVQGDFGKPRPALVIQSDAFGEDITFNVTVLLITSTLIEAPVLRITVEPTPGNGLREISQIMIDKVMTVRRDKIGPVIGRMDGPTMFAVNGALSVFLAIA
ncbi:growth inhibitor PemK [Devosia geojensis]|uniref:Growth inhibitor PemK n=1 Tax=Devosia geojensis TaxID=443610 RepID=A0A0F5FT15_9HYPH|nr:type II toxin-antitoxin system PemK/MazF family toxin [Devosia geojensis]KKB12009.1 growth inhibitor PemK [Devosia geojensis]